MTTLFIFLGSLVVTFAIFRPGIAKKRYNSKLFTGETRDRIFYMLFFGIVLTMLIWMIGANQQWWM